MGPDGVADDTAAVAAGVSAALAAGVPLHLNHGQTYRIAGFVATGSGLTIEGNGATIVTSSAGGSTVRVVDNVRLRNLNLKNTDESSGNAIALLMPGAVNVEFTGCSFTGGTRSQGIAAISPGIANVLIDGCRFDNLAYGVLTDGMGAGKADDIKEVRVANCEFANIYGDAVELNHPADVVGDPERTAAEGFVVANNIISVPAGLGTSSVSGFGIGVAGVRDLTITGNVIRTARQEGIHLEDGCWNVAIVGNTIQQVSGPIARAGVKVTGNVVSECGDNGIEVLGYPELCVVSSNVVSDCGGYGVETSGTAAARGTLHLRDNLVARCSSGDYSGATLGAGFAPTVIDTRSARNVSPVADGSGYVVTPLFRLGGFADGRVTLTASGSGGRTQAGGNVGWVCVSSGSPGTWKSFGTISA